jgi:SsrA-binding protein
MTNKIAENRKARFDFNIIDTLEAGIVLLGSEVKSLRLGKASIKEAYASSEKGEFFLINFNIPTYSLAAKGQSHEPKRLRKLLVHNKEKNKIHGLIKREGYTIVPLSCYFNQKGYVKVLLGLAKGKKQIDKRQEIKKRDWNIARQRLLKS